MNSAHEIIEYRKELPIKLFCQRIGLVNKHWHRSIEILLVLSGSMDICIEDKHYSLSENDLILINSNQVHETYSEDCVLIALQIRLSLFQSNWHDPEKVYFNCNSGICKSDVPKKDFTNNPAYFDILRQLIARLIQINTSNSTNAHLLSVSYLFALMNELFLHFEAAPPIIQRSQKHMDRLKNILDYIEENYNQDLTLTGLAAREYLTPPYLSSFFEKNMNVSLNSYINRIRMDHSLEHLLYSEESIEEIASQCGFASPRSYSTLFRRQYGMRPSLYRKEQKGNLSCFDSKSNPNNRNYLNLEKFNYFEKLSTYLKSPDSLLTQSQEHPAHLALGSISTRQETTTLSHNELNFCSVGKAKELLYGNIREMLTLQQAEIGFRYIKFHGIFDDSLMVYQEDFEGCPFLNFTMVDEILDFLLSIHLRPLIQLSFMPSALAKDASRTFFVIPSIISEPKENSKWGYLVSEFTAHLLDRYGLKEVSKWIFTFWNETLSYLPFDFDNDNIFLRLYEITWKSVKKYSSVLKFANTSFADTTFPAERFRQFLDFTKAHHCEPDVYLFHFYPTQPNHAGSLHRDAFISPPISKISSPPMLLSEDPDLFQKYIVSLNANLPERDHKPLYITEWNLSPSHREWLNDTCYACAYFVRNILQNYDKADSFCHWCLTDWIEELNFPEELFHGGVGHFTKNGIKKPAYYAYLFLSKLKDELVKQGEGYFITKDAETDNYSILLYNYCHFTNLYSQGYNFDVSSTERYNIFVNAVNKEIEFTLIDISNGDYIISEQIVNRHSGSCFDEWLKMGATPLDTKEEIDTLKQLSTPTIIKKMCTIDNHLLVYTGNLEPHEVRLIQIKKKDLKLEPRNTFQEFDFTK